MEEQKATHRTTEEACLQIKAITDLMNVKVAEIKYTEVITKGQKEMRATGSFEFSPFTDKEVAYLKAAAFSLVNQYIEKGELVRQAPKVEESKVEEVKTETNE